MKIAASPVGVRPCLTRMPSANGLPGGDKWKIVAAGHLQHMCRSGAWGETRTLTWLPKPDFESGASANFATQAGRIRLPRCAKK